jgi:hypothetical protein
MIDVDAAVRAMRDADPVPDPESFRRFVVDAAVFLDATRERNMEIQTELEAVETPKASVPMWRKALPALVAAAVVILIGAAILLLARDTEPDVADTPQGMAVLFIEGDADTAVGMLAPDAVVEHGIATTVEEYAAVREWQVVTGTFATVTGCSETPIASNVEVSCTYIHGNAWSEALGVGPFDGSQWVFVIADGQIQELNNTFDASEYSPQSNQVFRSWLGVNHPGVSVSMIDLATANQVPILTPESIALWEQYTEEFVASVAESGTP